MATEERQNQPGLFHEIERHSWTLLNVQVEQRFQLESMREMEEVARIPETQKSESGEKNGYTQVWGETKKRPFTDT